MPLDSLPTTSPAIEKLRLGRALIEKRGLAWGQVQDAAGRVCAVGGITRSTGREESIGAAIGYLARAISVPDYSQISAWNDTPGRTKADVLAAYDRAIDLAVADALVGR